ncbi:MAG TPA: hypothetical protein VMH26_18030 [Burkholderiales bacterium]|nr:hypothetical protein [Burkholderiales bacterium]
MRDLVFTAFSTLIAALLLGAASVQAQVYPTPFGPESSLSNPEENAKEIKRIQGRETSPIPEVNLDELRSAEAQITYFEGLASRTMTLPDSNALKTKAQPVISQILKKPCNPIEVSSSATEFGEVVRPLTGAASGIYWPVEGAAAKDTALAQPLIDILSWSPSTSDQALCKVVQRSNEKDKDLSQALEAYFRIFESRAQREKTRIESQTSLAAKLADAWKKRKEVLLKTIAEQKKQTTDIFVASLPYIVLIFCLFGLSLIAVIRIFGDTVQMEWVASGQVIQFASVMVLLIIVTSLGILHILEKEGIGTLLGAIAGYVLSQGVGRAAARAATREQSEERKDAPPRNDTSLQAKDGAAKTENPAQSKDSAPGQDMTDGKPKE